MKEVVKVPTLSDLITEKDEKQNELNVLLNQPPPRDWLKEHPFISLKDENNKPKKYLYIPRERMEYMLTRIFQKWWVEVKVVQLIANSVVVTVRVYVRNPLTGETDWQDGVGASPLQTKKGKGAIDFNEMQASAVQMSAPSAETYAFKDAVEKFGKLFGKDLNVRDIDYNTLLSSKPTEKEKPILQANTEEWSRAVKGIQDGFIKVSDLVDKYQVTEENHLKLKSYETI